MDQNVIDKIKACFQNRQEAQKMYEILENAGVFALDELQILAATDLYNQGLDNSKINKFFGLCNPNAISDEFYNKLQSCFTNPDQLTKVVGQLRQANILNEMDFLQSEEKACGMPPVSYRKIKSICQQNDSESVVVSPNQYQPKNQSKSHFFVQENFLQMPHFAIKNTQITLTVPNGDFLGQENGLKIYKYSCQTFDKKDAKIILTVGETGSGKTTLLNFMANYLQDVQLTDSFRYKMINENFAQTQDQSQTQKVQDYYIRGVNGKPNVIVVDTPGFCDTQGGDKRIVQQLGTFFKDLKDLHLVGFVLKASDNKLTVKQQYIFSSILQIFGKDIAENIVSFLTFSDASQPGALVALKAQDSPFLEVIHQIKQPWYFQFNNSALYSDPGKQLTPAFWNIGVKSLDELFQKKVSSIPRKQLVQTGLVISETETLHYMVNGLQRQLDQTLQYIDALKDLQRQIELNKSNIENNRNFKINTKIPSIQQVPIPNGECITNCRDCQFTCHYVCNLPKDEDKRHCAAINDEYCKVCPRKCHYTKHGHDPFKHVPIMIDKTTTCQDMLNSYNSAIQCENQYTSLITSATNNLRQAYEQAIKLQVTIVACRNKLDQIALMQPKCKSQIQYIELMEITEQNTKQDGWQTRLKVYGELKNKWILIEEAYKKTGRLQNLMDYAQEWIQKNNWF